MFVWADKEPANRMRHRQAQPRRGPTEIRSCTARKYSASRLLGLPIGGCRSFLQPGLPSLSWGNGIPAPDCAPLVHAPSRWPWDVPVRTILPSWRRGLSACPPFRMNPFAYSEMGFSGAVAERSGAAALRRNFGDLAWRSRMPGRRSAGSSSTMSSRRPTTWCPAAPATNREFAFADAAPGSMGISGHVLHRNTLGLFNLGYQRRLFWDLRGGSGQPGPPAHRPPR